MQSVRLRLKVNQSDFSKEYVLYDILRKLHVCVQFKCIIFMKKRLASGMLHLTQARAFYNLALFTPPRPFPLFIADNEIRTNEVQDNHFD
jgi:hypothetical protein